MAHIPGLVAHAHVWDPNPDPEHSQHKAGRCHRDPWMAAGLFFMAEPHSESLVVVKCGVFNHCVLGCVACLILSPKASG